jgi:uncharacterized OsmC-like protein
MAVEITGTYTGDLKMELTHGPSGAALRAAAPLDNGGDGSSFSPTDLLATALGSCAVMTMAIVAQREGIPFGEASFHVEKHMATEPRRVGRLPLTITMPKGLSAEQRGRLERIARACPVERSLSEGVEREFRFVYED